MNVLSSAKAITLTVVISAAMSGLVTATILQSARPSLIIGSEDEVIRDALARVAPSVVSITISSASSTIAGGGSGFIVRSDGYVITNRHVVADGADSTYTVTMSNGKEYGAVLIGVDQVLDLALLKIPAEKLPVATLGDSSVLFTGQTVLAIGNSLAEFQNSVTKGIISGLGRQVVAGDFFGDAEVLEGAIQTDAAINPGLSGGPLITVRGEVIGVNTAVSRRGQLVGFALPINSVKQLIASAVEFGRIIHPWLGVRYRIVSNGALIVKGLRPEDKPISANSPAEKAGLREGDIITGINATDLSEYISLANEVAKYRVGDTIILRIIRADAVLDVPITLEEFPQTKKP